MAENILQHPEFDSIATQLETDRGLPPGTLRAVARQESGGNPNALSNKGAQGTYQFIPSTAKLYNVDVTNPWDSMRGAADYLGDNMKKYGKIEAALADYNGGPSQAHAVLKNGSPTFPETQGYVTKIMKNIGNVIIPSAEASENAPIAAPTDKLKQLAGLKVFTALQKGVAAEDIVNGLVTTAPPEIAAAVKRNLQNGVAPADIVQGIAKSQIAEHEQMLKDTDPTKDMSPVERGLAGAGKYLSDTGHGAQQLYERGKYFFTGDDSKIKELQAKAAEQEKLDAPLLNTTAGKVGYVGGALAPTLATMGAGAVVNAPRLAAAANATRIPGAVTASKALLNPTTVSTAGANGAANTLLTPTDHDQSLGEVALGAGIGAGTMGLGKTVAKVISPNQGAKAAELGKVLGKANAEGLDVTAGQLLRNGASVDAEKAAQQQALLDALKARTTQAGTDAITGNTEALNHALFTKSGAAGAKTLDEALPLAQQAVRDAYSGVFKGTQIPLDKGALTQKLDDLLTHNSNLMDESKVGQLAKLQNELERVAPTAADGSTVVSGDVADQFIKRLNKVAKDAQGNDIFQGAVRDFRDAVQGQLEAGLGATKTADLAKAKELWNSKRLLEALQTKAKGNDLIEPIQANQTLWLKKFNGSNPLGSDIEQALNSQKTIAADNATKKVDVEALAKALYGRSGNPKVNGELGQMALFGGAGTMLGELNSGHEGGLAGGAAALLSRKALAKALTANANGSVGKYMLGQHGIQKNAVKAMEKGVNPLAVKLAEALYNSKTQ